MLESQINARLKNVPRYLGTFAIDELKSLRVRHFPAFLIINLDTRDGGGSHWIALAVYLHDVYVCDSLGTLVPDSRFPKELINFLHQISFSK